MGRLETFFRERGPAVGLALLLAIVFMAGMWAGLVAGRRDVEREPEQPQAAPEQPRVHADAPTARTNFTARARQRPLRALPESAWSSAPVAPALNMRETLMAYNISVSLSGVHPNDLRIRTEHSILVIQADLKHPDTGKSVSTEGRLRIPADARLEALAAAFSNGYLHVTIPRR